MFIIVWYLCHIPSYVLIGALISTQSIYMSQQFLVFCFIHFRLDFEWNASEVTQTKEESEEFHSIHFQTIELFMNSMNNFFFLNFSFTFCWLLILPLFYLLQDETNHIESRVCVIFFLALMKDCFFSNVIHQIFKAVSHIQLWCWLIATGWQNKKNNG